NIIDALKVGVFITDGQGNVLMVNKESERTGGGMALEDILGKNMRYLQEVGYVDESSVLKAIENRDECRMIQKLADGGSLYVTAVPYFKDDKIELVICTERDVTETKILEKLLEETKELSERQAKELEYLRASSKSRKPKVIAKSEKMKKILQTARRISQLDTTVLISGESGVGKEVIADYIFNMGSRNDKPFVKINCAAIPDNLLESELFGYEKGAFTGADNKGKPGLFEIANGGTLFLDEVTEIPLRLQAKFLRVLQEREFMRIGGKMPIQVNVRIVAATNRDLKEAIECGAFREDLYYRLNVVPLEIPPLRERKEDIKALAEYFVENFSEEYNIKKNISTGALSELMCAPWHGNIRELRNMIERAMVVYDGEHITARQVKNLLKSAGRDKNRLSASENITLNQLMEEYEREVLVSYLEQYHTAAEVARKLHVDKSTIGRKLKKYDIIFK
ncbi:MAG: sigma-54 interaction domain-containing protein, partial [Lentihominibacter sp.]